MYVCICVYIYICMCIHIYIYSIEREREIDRYTKIIDRSMVVLGSLPNHQKTPENTVDIGC